MLEQIVYVPYGGLYGDCGTYYGWVVGVHNEHPNQCHGLGHHRARGGIWGVSGIASDGTDMLCDHGQYLRGQCRLGRRRSGHPSLAQLVLANGDANYWAADQLAGRSTTKTWTLAERVR